ncbi:MAG: 4Fe-4S dicluster domain-containing protein [Candidatus Zixiibacteriota bacterium]
MLGEFYSFEKKDFAKFIYKLTEYGKIANFLPLKGKNPALSFISEKNHIQLEDFDFDRQLSMDSPRLLLQKPYEQIGKFVNPTEKVVFFGLKNCDIYSILIHDKVFLYKEPIDENYKEIRNNSIIVSFDCRIICENCFASSFLDNPYPSGNFDLNISIVDDRFLVQTGSQKGVEIIGQLEKKKASNSEKQQLFDKREMLKTEFQKRKIDLENFYQIEKLEFINEGLDAITEPDKCLNCGACDYICPASNQFKIQSGSEYIHSKWSTFFQNSNLASYKFKERFIYKFLYFRYLYNCIACSGCGRCTNICPGGIDIADIHRKLNAFLERRINENISI